MLIKSLGDLESFEAGDKTAIIEVLHPKNDNIPLGYSLAHASLEIGESSIPHILEKCSETYFILQGHAKMVIDKEERLVGKGDTIFIPEGATQHVENQGDIKLEFLCIVSPAWYEAQETIL